MDRNILAGKVWETGKKVEVFITAILPSPTAPFPVQGRIGKLSTCWTGTGIHSSNPEYNLESFKREMTDDEMNTCC